MKKETKGMIIVAAAVLAVFGIAYVGVIVYAGTSSPFYTVESESMMHSENSRIGIIDVGDMVIIRDTSKANITTYVEGRGNGYAKFGDFGDVIVYSRPGGTPVIHRAMLYVEYAGLDSGVRTWNVPSLAGYGGVWYINGVRGDAAAAGAPMSGVLRFEGLGWAERTVEINLNTLAASGYITMGDNNSVPDAGVVSKDRIIGVASIEIPWLGCIKLYATGNNTDKIPMNSVLMLILSLSMIVIAVVAVTVLYGRRKQKK